MVVVVVAMVVRVVVVVVLVDWLWVFFFMVVGGLQTVLFSVYFYFSHTSSNFATLQHIAHNNPTVFLSRFFASVDIVDDTLKFCQTPEANLERRLENRPPMLTADGNLV